MRIIAGTLKGRRLATPSWPGLRPTSDKLRETLFNVVAARVPRARVLDGFAGTGAVGLEALSRGAAHATLVEQDRRAIGLVEENVARCGLRDRCAIIRADFSHAARERLAGARFDLAFLDPPYDRPDGLDDVLSAVAPLMAPGGLIVLEHARRDPAPSKAGDFVRVRDLVSGDSALAFYGRTGAARAEDSAPDPPQKREER
jgi:16S rRNA (guanine(966)-N(2))-methyltransferase RsmD